MRNMIDFFLCWHRKKSNPPFESLISMDSPIPFEQDGCRFVGGHIDTAHTSVFIHSELDKADAFCFEHEMFVCKMSATAIVVLYIAWISTDIFRCIHLV